MVKNGIAHFVRLFFERRAEYRQSVNRGSETQRFPYYAVSNSATTVGGWDDVQLAILNNQAAQRHNINPIKFYNQS